MIRRTLLALAASTTVAGAAFAMSHSKDIVENATEAGNFTTLLAAAEAAGLVETLKGEGPYTLFAPTDEAFEALPEGTVEELMEDTERLTAILTYHVVPGKVMSGDLSDGMMADTVNGAQLEIGTEGGSTVNGATVRTLDIEASNGVIHAIGTVLMPPEA